MLASGAVTPDALATVARRILHPYTLEVKDVAWCSVYTIGQRLCDAFDDVPTAERGTRMPRVFIAGDACHTHNAKADQGMNVSMADAWNLRWKPASVQRGTPRSELLSTYTVERQPVVQELIDFDREFSQMFTTAPRHAVAGDTESPASGSSDVASIDPAELQGYFVSDVDCLLHAAELIVPG